MTTTDTRPTRQGALLKAALRLLAEDGPSALKARTVTSEADLTTMALYSAFGGMPGLMTAVVEEGFAQLDARMRTIEPSDDSVADLFSMAIECRRFATENRHLYDLIFGPESRDVARGKLLADVDAAATDATSYQQSFATLAHACDRAIRAGRVRSPSGRHLAAQLWSLVHGYISLELGGHFAAFADPVDEILIPLCVGFMTGQGDDRDKSLSSTTKTMV
ncbi:TetR-like C-terminal domain-containing protein [Nocardioides sp. HM23]|uniref:TetR-like C-terminal domain-containing protein n=1 Tax=Nocardioides bizhenqiangii TaxID=3095076 RepID=UPI002ACA2EDA|nr:TetR-like C-terminal domain-containing protein [Nocardioides sp. HM23]MDZ5621053.1 TetR-like C-terminal domain-containing protein [Nocardioides sp. HM23]